MLKRKSMTSIHATNCEDGIRRYLNFEKDYKTALAKENTVPHIRPGERKYRKSDHKRSTLLCDRGNMWQKNRKKHFRATKVMRLIHTMELNCWRKLLATRKLPPADGSNWIRIDENWVVKSAGMLEIPAGTRRNAAWNVRLQKDQSGKFANYEGHTHQVTGNASRYMNNKQVSNLQLRVSNKNNRNTIKWRHFSCYLWDWRQLINY